MNSEMTEMVDRLAKMLDKGTVKCESCGCVVSIAGAVCSQCGAVLPDVKSEKKKNKKEWKKLNITFSGNPQFDQDLWLEFYRNCFDLGIRLAEIFNGKDIDDIDESRVNYLIRVALLAKMYNAGTASAEASKLYYDKNENMVEDVESMGGFNSFNYITKYAFDWALQQGPVIMGFMYGSDGTPIESRLGKSAFSIFYGLYYCLESLQEIVLLAKSYPDDLMCEQYVSKFRSTPIPRWSKSKADGIFSSLSYDWDESPMKFRDSVLENKKMMKKFFKDYRWTVYSYLDSRDFHQYNPNSPIIKGIVEMADAVSAYSYDKACSLFGFEDTVFDRSQVNKAMYWIKTNLMIDNIAIV